MDTASNSDDQFYNKQPIDIEELQKTVDNLVKIVLHYERRLKDIERTKEYGSPIDPSRYPKYQIDGIILHNN